MASPVTSHNNSFLEDLDDEYDFFIWQLMTGNFMASSQSQNPWSDREPAVNQVIIEPLGPANPPSEKRDLLTTLLPPEIKNMVVDQVLPHGQVFEIGTKDSLRPSLLRVNHELRDTYSRYFYTGNTFTNPTFMNTAGSWLQTVIVEPPHPGLALTKWLHKTSEKDIALLNRVVFTGLSVPEYSWTIGFAINAPSISGGGLEVEVVRKRLSGEYLKFDLDVHYQETTYGRKRGIGFSLREEKMRKLLRWIPRLETVCAQHYRTSDTGRVGDEKKFFSKAILAAVMEECLKDGT